MSQLLWFSRSDRIFRKEASCRKFVLARWDADWHVLANVYGSLIPVQLVEKRCSTNRGERKPHRLIWSERRKQALLEKSRFGNWNFLAWEWMFSQHRWWIITLWTSSPLSHSLRLVSVVMDWEEKTLEYFCHEERRKQIWTRTGRAESVEKDDDIHRGRKGHNPHDNRSSTLTENSFSTEQTRNSLFPVYHI